VRACWIENAPRLRQSPINTMKSAYELAMERLAKNAPQEAQLTPAKKTRLAELDTLYKGKLAEREVFLKGQLNTALADANLEEAEKIREQMRRERTRLEEEREDEKERVRRGR
jgi:CHAT domain-containing protein